MSAFGYIDETSIFTKDKVTPRKDPDPELAEGEGNPERLYAKYLNSIEYGKDIVRHSEKSEITVKHNLPGWVRLPAPQLVDAQLVLLSLDKFGTSAFSWHLLSKSPSVFVKFKERVSSTPEHSSHSPFQYCSYTARGANLRGWLLLLYE
ncbi:hypothetical protein A2865_04290 [Candidatus Woesebacteria bacterium RIFCSPHIGHO2_01_FULL_39_17]|nr:MAG: hypothetical protein US72_C0003G0021 [Microgenomates group bacterium GW2011_GWC1_38_12]KKS76707.1 MAG: hypothetical protein UV50_C0016G0004 [Parcubacteria group bacterium GW2011_GWB1_42_9]OGM22424.1 MAG: hypothetical protein A2865_04290 [Candidatus Woesebacteria bacterium RIFCSPHIGHO2_01_FULL_39_17]